MSLSTVNKAFIAFDAITSIIQYETEQIKKSQMINETTNNITSNEPVIDIEMIQANVFDKVMNKLEGYFAAFEERMNLKLDQIKPAPVDLSKVYNITDAITKTVNQIEDKLNAIEVEEVAARPSDLAPEPTPKATEPVPKAPEPTPEHVDESEVEEEIGDEESHEEERGVGSERSESPHEEEEDAEEELTDFLYKGKTYYMDSEYNVYAQDENGDLIEDPVGTYNEATRKITFN